MAICEFEYHRPKSVPEACELSRKLGKDAAFLAGGTELLPDFKRGRDERQHLITLREIEVLQGIAEDDGTLRIGALTRLRDVERSPLVRRLAPVVADAASVIGGVQIRQQGTIGGNFCRAVPCADTPPACIVSKATVRIVSPDGERVIPASDLFVGPRLTILEPGEILQDILVPPQPAGSGASYQRFSLRRGAGLAVASVAARVVLDDGLVADARIALGAVAPVPLLAAEAGHGLHGHPPDDDRITRAARTAAREAQPITDLRGTEEFRRDLVEVLARRALTEAVARAAGKERS
jgi:carbon-monoxide dehydrogenase medium subunit